MGRIEKITEEVRKYDRELYCKRNTEGKPCVYRKSQRWEHYDLGFGKTLLYSRPADHYVFALTHNWKPTGYEVDWGLLVISERLKAMDLWKRDVAKDLIETYEKDKKSNERAHSNNIEGFLYEYHSQFKKTFNDINTANMNKNYKERKGA